MAEKETRAERVYMGIRTDILSGMRAPGDRLPTAEFCARFDTSVGVVREALLRLAEHGLVQVRPMQGFRVSELTADDLRDLTEARLDIETLALRYAVEQGDRDWEARVVGAHHLLSVAPQHSGDPAQRFTPEWGKAHGSFHTALLEGCRNRRILAAALRLRDSAELYRRWSVTADRHANRDLVAEHRELLDAALARDGAAAADVLASHIRRTDEILRAHL